MAVVGCFTLPVELWGHMYVGFPEWGTAHYIEVTTHELRQITVRDLTMLETICPEYCMCVKRPFVQI